MYQLYMNMWFISFVLGTSLATEMETIILYNANIPQAKCIDGMV